MMYRLLVSISTSIVFFYGCETKTETIDSRIVFDTIANRPLQIYLPPDYDISNTYPVAYFCDGQNIFLDETSFAGEWKVDEVLDSLIAADKIEPIIVVGIYNSKKRSEEYVPYLDSQLVKWMQIDQWDSSIHREYSRLVTNSIMPFIQSKYGGSFSKENNAIFGSSLGGINALALGSNQQEKFGFIAAISPSSWLANGAVIEDMQGKEFNQLKVWIDQGSKEYDRRTRALASTLMEKSEFEYGKNLWYFEVLDAEHNEYSWSRRVAYPFLLFKGKASEPISNQYIPELFFWKEELDNDEEVMISRLNVLVLDNRSIKYTYLPPFNVRSANGTFDETGNLLRKDSKNDSAKISSDEFELNYIFKK